LPASDDGLSGLEDAVAAGGSLPIFQGPMLWFKKIFCRENSVTKVTAILYVNLNVGFYENRQFSPEKWRKSSEIMIIPLAPGEMCPYHFKNINYLQICTCLK
jgi:hypothetical protein